MTTINQASIEEEALSIFKETNALIEGHFVLRSGLHSGHFFQCAMVGQYMDKVTRLAELIIQKLPTTDFDTVLAPAMGGLVIGQEVARQLNKRYIFVEKNEGKLELRRGFKITPGEKILIVEDVVTRGGRAQESLDIAQGAGAEVTAIALLVDRSEGKAAFNVPHISLLKMTYPTYEADKLTPELAAIPVTKPGSK